MNWETFLTTIGVGIAVITYLEVRFNRVRGEIRESEDRTRDEIRESEKRTNARIDGLETNLRGEIRASEERTRREMKEGFAEAEGKNESLQAEVQQIGERNYGYESRLSKLEARAELKDKAEQDKDAA